MKNISEKIFNWLEKIHPRLAKGFREKPVLMLIMVLVSLLLVLAIFYVIWLIIMAICHLFGVVFHWIGSHKQGIVGFLIVCSVTAVVHKLAASLANLVLIALIIGGTYIALDNSYGWGDTSMKCLVAGIFVGVVTLPLHTFLWKDKDK